MHLSARITIALSVVASLLIVASPVRAVGVGCDRNPSSDDIQAVIDTNPSRTRIRLARNCIYSVTETILLKNGDSLIGRTTSRVPETFLVGSRQAIDCIGSMDPTGTADATAVRIATLDISRCRTGIQLNDEWKVGGSGGRGVWSHDNDIGLNLGSVEDPALDVRVSHVRLVSNDQIGLKGAMWDTGAAPRATIAFSKIIANGGDGTECTPTTNCAGAKLFGGYAGRAGVSPLVCGNVVRDNTGLPIGQGHGLWVDVTADNVGRFGQGLLFAGNTVEDNSGQGFRIERSDSHRIGARGDVKCAGHSIDATNIINDNGTPGGSCVAVIVSEYTEVTNNTCNVQDHAHVVKGRVIQITWKPRADLDEDHDGDIECTSSDPGDCQRTAHNIVRNNTIRLQPSTDPAATSAGFYVSVSPFPKTWVANDYVSNDYCVASKQSVEKRADHFSWARADGTRIVHQPWRRSGAGNDWRDAPGPRYDGQSGASFSRTCPAKRRARSSPSRMLTPASASAPFGGLASSARRG
jgi:hypothetical protein